MEPRRNPGLAVVCSMNEMHRDKVLARSDFGGAIWYNFILPVKEDA